MLTPCAILKFWSRRGTLRSIQKYFCAWASIGRVCLKPPEKQLVFGWKYFPSTHCTLESRIIVENNAEIIYLPEKSATKKWKFLRKKNISHQFNSDYFTEKAHKENLRHRLGSKATVATKEKCSKCKVDWISREARDSRGSAKPCGLKKEEEEENIRKEKSSIVCEAAKIGFIFLQYFSRQIFIFFGWVTTFDTLTNFRNYFSGSVGGLRSVAQNGINDLLLVMEWRRLIWKVDESTKLGLTKCALWNDWVI